MRNIINWTFGGFFRTLGRILCFLVLGTIVGYLISVSGFKLPSWLSIATVKADTIDYNFKQYRVQFYSLANNTDAWTNWANFGSSTTLSSGYGVRTIAVRFGQTNNFNAGQTYRVVVEYGISPQSEISNMLVNTTSCYGSTSTSSWSNNQITDCNYIGQIRVNGTNHVQQVFDITPTTAYKGIQINLNFSGTSQISVVNVYTKSTITTGADVEGAINEQTIIIQDSITQNTENIINAITESNKICQNTIYEFKYDDRNKLTPGYLNVNGDVVNSTTTYLTDYIENTAGSTLKITNSTGNLGQTSSYCIYNKQKVKINCYQYNGAGTITTTLNQDGYIRASVYLYNSTFKVTIEGNFCKNGEQAVFDSINDLNDTLNDTDTTEDSNEVSSFFQDFTLSIEGPISQIVMLPIDLLNILIVDYNANQTHNDLCTTFKGQTICLPSGDIVWKRSGCHDNNVWGLGCSNVTPFRNFLQLTVGGYIIYKLLRKLVESVEKGLDPQSTRVDLMKL